MSANKIISLNAYLTKLQDTVKSGRIPSRHDKTVYMTWITREIKRTEKKIEELVLSGKTK